MKKYCQLFKYLIHYSLMIGFIVGGQNVMAERVKQKNINNEDSSTLLLQLASPQWQDQIIYFLMIDRFNDGDPENNDQGTGEYDPRSGSHYSGGDLLGITQKLDYIKSLGATTIWITPPVANQWWSQHRKYGGYHGYWAIDFKSVDAHFGTLNDYKKLSDQLHRKGMYLIQDIVTNHTGNFFGYKGTYDAGDSLKNFVVYESADSAQATPTQHPFDLIDRSSKTAVAANVYHWTPAIADYRDPSQQLTYQLAGLADINTENKMVRKVLKQSYRYWIDQVGVDGFRVDTVKFVEHDFWFDFFNSSDGINNAAKAAGKDDFLSIGEVYEISAEGENSAEKKAASYIGTTEKPELKSVLGFPLFATLTSVYSQGRPTSLLAYRLKQQMLIYPNPYIIANFVDNHDTPRFLADGSIDALKQALFTIFTIAGIPVIYQGTEQAMEETRASMFAKGFHGKKNNFNKKSPMYLFIKKLAKLRKKYQTLSRGDLRILYQDNESSGVLVYERSYLKEKLVIIINSADRSKLLSNLKLDRAVDFENNIIFKENLNLSEIKKYQQNKYAGKINLLLPARAMLVLKLNKDKNNSLNTSTEPYIHFKEDYARLTLTADAWLRGTSKLSNAKLLLVINDEIEDAHGFTTDKNGAWKVLLPVTKPGFNTNNFVIFAKDYNLVSKKINYFTNLNQAEISFEIIDSLNDDNGILHQYKAPQQSASQHQMDIEKVTVNATGDNLELVLKMHNVSAVWNPNNDFDNVSFSLFFSIPGKQGNEVLPRLNAKMPDSLHWTFAHVFFGWGNTLYSTKGASQRSFGEKISSAAVIKVNKEKREISVSYQGLALGVKDWRGSKVYITTWDKNGEGNYRRLSTTGSEWLFGGGAEGGPKIMDDLLITIPSNIYPCHLKMQVSVGIKMVLG